MVDGYRSLLVQSDLRAVAVNHASALVGDLLPSVLTSTGASLSARNRWSSSAVLAGIMLEIATTQLWIAEPPRCAMASSDVVTSATRQPALRLGRPGRLHVLAHQGRDTDGDHTG
jgi:hypothetical protein